MTPSLSGGRARGQDAERGQELEAVQGMSREAGHKLLSAVFLWSGTGHAYCPGSKLRQHMWGICSQEKQTGSAAGLLLGVDCPGMGKQS